MLCRIALAVFLLVIPTFSASAQQNVDAWQKWVAEKVNGVKIKQTAIKEFRKYHELVCSSAQFPDSKRSKCHLDLDVIIDRRDQEQDLLLDLILATTLTTKARDEKIARLNPAYNRMDAETTQLETAFFANYSLARQGE